MLDKDMSRISVESSLSHSAEYFRRWESLSDSLISDTEKVCIIEREGVRVSRFPSKKFCLTLPKTFVGEPFCAVSQKNSGSEKVYVKEGGVVKTFSVEKI